MQAFVYWEKAMAICGGMAKKIQLNDAQWNKLQSLANENGRSTPNETTGVSHRLRSNGLVASERKGREYLTDQGARRLSQGR
jgi:hypothetical protein